MCLCFQCLPSPSSLQEGQENEPSSSALSTLRGAWSGKGHVLLNTRGTEAKL